MPRTSDEYKAQLARWVATADPRQCKTCGATFQPDHYRSSYCPAHKPKPKQPKDPESLRIIAQRARDRRARNRRKAKPRTRRVTPEEHQALKEVRAHLHGLVGDGGEPYHPNLNLAVKRVAFAQREGPAAYYAALIKLIADCAAAAGQAAEAQQRPTREARDHDELRAVA